MMLERALVQYDKNGEYDYTIESKFLYFKTKEECFLYIFENIDKDIEYYIYETREDFVNNNHCITFICNNSEKVRI